MAISPQQVSANHILQKIVPLLHANPATATNATNLEWNAKKFLGQVPGETLDEKTFAERVKSDLEAAQKVMGGNAELASAIAGVADRFGIAIAGAPAPSGSGHAASAESSKDLAAVAAAAQAGVVVSGSEDIGEALAARAEKSGENLDWENSVVDLLKLFGQDHSVGARRKMMTSLGLDASTAGSEAGNDALREALMGKLATTGGNWPANIA